MKKLNNKGSTLVLVIIVLAIVSVFAVVALSISLYNFQMKITDKNVKDNFYSAETVLDQICVGLQGDVSKAYSGAYSEVMQNYNSISDNETADMKEARRNKFEKSFLKNLTQLLQSDNTGYRYDIAKLRGYVSNEIIVDGTQDSSKPHVIIETTTGTTGSEDCGLLNSYYPSEAKLALKGIKVTYTDIEGYTSIIETDICIDCPELNFVNSGEMPDVFSFSLIGNKGIDVADSSNNVEIEGSVYAGSNFVIDNSKNTADDVLSLNIGNGANVSFENLKYLIAQGTIYVNGKSSSLKVGTDSQVWTENILVNSSTVNLLGSTYLSDDLTLEGENPSATLGYENSGKYVGYGNEAQAAGSSSIIINGKNSKLDLTGLNELFLAGYSYINSSSISTYDNNKKNSNVGMGSSITLKGDQIAYLVPGECIGVNKSGDSKYNKNPLTYLEYKEIINNSHKYKEVDGSVVSEKVGNSLEAYLERGQNISQCVSTVFVPASSGNPNDGLVYYYINLSSDMAKKYYADFYGNNENKLNTYADFYANAIKMNESSTVYTAGKYSLYEDESLDVLPEGSWSEDKVNNKIADVTEMYYSLRSTLTGNSASAEARTNLVFNNVINEQNLAKVTNGKTLNRQFVTYTSSDNTQKCSALLADNGGVTGSSIDVASVLASNQDANIKLIVATGDVLVNADFEGTIITKGQIKVTGSHKIKNAKLDEIKRLLSAQVQDGVKLYDIFVAGESYLTETDDSISENSNISYTDLITYENWKKE